MTKTIALVLALVASSPAFAQTADVVVMRRTLTAPKRTVTPPTPPAPVAANCSDPVAGWASSGPRIIILGVVSTAAQAGDMCRAYVIENPATSGICILDRNNNLVSINSGSYITTSGNYSGSQCSR